MQIRQPLRKIQFQAISQKLIKLDHKNSVYHTVFMVNECNKIYLIRIRIIN